MAVRTEGETRIEDGTGTVVAIERKTRNAKVSLEVQGLKFPVSAWVDLSELGVKEGDRVHYEIRKEGDDYRRYSSLAPVRFPGEGKDGTTGSEPHASSLSASGVDDVQAGVANPILDSPTPAEHDGPVTRDEFRQRFNTDVPNRDTQRFEGWGFVANVGMVDLAYEELSDALEAGELDSISPELLKTVAGHLLNAADQAQRTLVGRTDRGAQSHTRARGCVRTALRRYPVRRVFAGTDLAMDIWAAEVQKTATRLLALAASL